ncbi:MAG: hypothetical protein JWR39_1567, partial [Devosia sp.]|nr:hypothetical protein [Devosia sp.]
MSSTLDDFLQASSASQPALRSAATTISHLAQAAIALHAAIASGRVPQAPAPVQDHTNASGETQKSLDLYADQLFLEAAQKAPVAWYGSEEQDLPVPVGEGELALAIDPLDGSSNIETNIAVGTIFSLLPVPAEHQSNPAGIYNQPGTAQRAA